MIMSLGKKAKEIKKQQVAAAAGKRFGSLGYGLVDVSWLGSAVVGGRRHYVHATDDGFTIEKKGVLVKLPNVTWPIPFLAQDSKLTPLPKFAQCF